MATMQSRPVGDGRGACAVAPDGICDFTSLGTFEDKSGKVGAVSVLQCRHCRIGISTPPLPDVAFLYEGRESQDFQPDTNGLARQIKQLAFARQARQILSQLEAAPGKVLDFGCGSGLFTRCLDDILGVGSVTGSDFHADAPAELAGRAYLPMNRLDECEGRFDTVLAMHVLEHDDDAAGLLHRVARMVRPGGRIVFEVPNIDCVWTRLFGQAWDAWYVPFHRTHFSLASLNGLVAGGGLELIATHRVSVPTTGRSLANLVGARNSLPFLLAGAMLHPVQIAGEKLSGQSSALRVIARKP
ncbi:class I SAM-dependent methyltransferase [Sphingomonas radiodurans]|uniref:class I SAM-dependent methyltransferase n=1 Tax=Sphingomonas radiodurans TaxID=2890321 RepID=UPI001E39AE98|nr:class I SAM-dependent methyltransferase [Sphingomonas radiodurans]WBH15114.1 class I SAM-dependent methyltransferase [Sphingomonas radiodurans]